MTHSHRPWHPLNQALAEAGAPAVIPEDWADVDAAAERIAEAHCSSDATLDRSRNHLSRAFGAETWQWFQESMDSLGSTPRDTSYLTAFGVPEDQARFDVVCQVVPLEISAVAHVSDYKRVAHRRMLEESSPLQGCCAKVSKKCMPGVHSKLWAHQRGTVILVVAMCPACRDLLYAGGPMDQVCRPVGTVGWVAQGDTDDLDTAIDRPEPPRTDPWDT